MNNRERMLAILNHQPPDRIPWAPRLELWYHARVLSGTLPKAWEGFTLRDVERALGVASPARMGKVLEAVDDEVEVVTWREGIHEIIEQRTPVGTLRRVLRHSEDLDRLGLPARIDEYPLKGPEDYRVWEWIWQHRRWVPTYDAYRAYDAEIGDDGLPMVSIGDVPFHEFLENGAGYEHAFFHLADHEREVARLLEVMREAERERMWPVAAASPARLLLHGQHLSTQFTPPRYFRKYILPYYQEFMPMMHAAGKAVAMHGDNDTSAILGLLEEAGYDMVECFVTAPMVPTTLRQAREAWGDRVIIFGGLPSLLLSPSVPEAEFRAYVEEALRVVAPGDAFILGVADNVMPDSVIERVAWVTEYMAEHGAYPLPRG